MTKFNKLYILGVSTIIALIIVMFLSIFILISFEMKNFNERKPYQTPVIHNTKVLIPSVKPIIDTLPVIVFKKRKAIKKEIINEPTPIENDSTK